MPISTKETKRNFIVIYVDECNDLHLLKNKHQETHVFYSECKAALAAGRNELCQTFQILELWDDLV